MKNIVIYVGSIFLPDKSAGAQRSLSLSKSLRDLGFKVVIVGMDSNISPKSYNILETKKTCEGFDTFVVPKPQSVAQWVHHTISIREIKAVIQYYGIKHVRAVIAMEYESIALWKLSNFCDRNGVQLVADAEEWYEHSRLSFPICLGKDIDTFLRMWYVYPYRIKNMICISRFFESYYKRRINNIVYVPGTIDKNQDKWTSLGKYTPNSVFTLSYAGHPGTRFEKERLDFLIMAVERLNQKGLKCRLLIAGVGRDYVEKRMNNHHISSNIVFMGEISHLECLKMIHYSDFSAIVRERKRVTSAGFPTKFSESLGCGTPVITTDSSNLKEYIIENENGIICPACTISGIEYAINKAMKISKSDLINMHIKTSINNPLVYQNYTQYLQKLFQ